MNKQEINDIFVFFLAKLHLNENATLVYLQNKIANNLEERKQKNAKYIKRILQVVNEYCKNAANLILSDLQVSNDIIAIISRYNKVTLY